MPRERAVGTNVLRKEGVEKVTGRARYLDDLSFPNLLYGRTIRSTIPAGEIAHIRLDFDTADFTIVDYRDIPGRELDRQMFVGAIAGLFHQFPRFFAVLFYVAAIARQGHQPLGRHAPHAFRRRQQGAADVAFAPPVSEVAGPLYATDGD